MSGTAANPDDVMRRDLAAASMLGQLDVRVRCDRLTGLLDAVDAARGLHCRALDDDDCCNGCGHRWPCRTTLALETAVQR